MFIDIERAKSIRGYMSHAELRWLAEHAALARTIVEVGCWQGRSTRALADHAQPGATVFAVDPWAGPYYADDGSPHKIETNVLPLFEAHLADHIASGRVVPLQGTFIDAFDRLFARADVRADLVFIDGDHRYDAVVQDIAIAELLTDAGAIIAGHDYDHPHWPGVKRAVDVRYPGAHRHGTIWWAERR